VPTEVCVCALVLRHFYTLFIVACFIIELVQLMSLSVFMFCCATYLKLATFSFHVCVSVYLVNYHIGTVLW